MDRTNKGIYSLWLYVSLKQTSAASVYEFPSVCDLPRGINWSSIFKGNFPVGPW